MTKNTNKNNYSFIASQKKVTWYLFLLYYKELLKQLKLNQKIKLSLFAFFTKNEII